MPTYRRDADENQKGRESPAKQRAKWRCPYGKSSGNRFSKQDRPGTASTILRYNPSLAPMLTRGTETVYQLVCRPAAICTWDTQNL
jgi:hypothetical protein